MITTRNFILHSIKNEDKDNIIVSNNIYNHVDGSYFTLITGENGCGKSSLLTKAVNAFIFSNNKEKNVLVAKKSIELPSRVIAICNSRYNRFPLRETFIRRGGNKKSDYYIQVDHNLEIGASVLSVVSQCLRKIIEHPISDRAVRLDDVRGAFKMIGINPLFLMKLKFDEKAIKLYKKLQGIVSIDNDIKATEDEVLYFKTFLSKNNSDNSSRPLLNIIQMLDLFDKLPQLHLNIDKRIVSFEGLAPEEESYIKTALLLGLIVPTEIQVQRVKESKWISNHHLSSGQQTLLMTALILDSFATKNSLICIDEPENSLHPAWQLDFMKFIDQLCHWNKGCHFLIATHSPQIISGLKSDNGCIVTLKNKGYRTLLKRREVHIYNNDIYLNNELQSLHRVAVYSKQSADRQLAEIFDSPGFRNDYVIHRLLMILSRLVKGVRLNHNDMPFIVKIEELINNNNIDEIDPVNIIYQQIMSVINVSGKDKKYD